MELIDISPSDTALWDEAWKLYVASFPEHERRSADCHAKALESNDFHTKAAVENGDLLAILFYWTFGDNDIYIEHIAVTPRMRGHNIGSSVLCEFAQQNLRASIILEIDPPQDEISQRRLAFYEKLGFHDSGFIFEHPSYRTGGRRHNLLILSYPSRILEDEFEKFVSFLNARPLAHTD